MAARALPQICEVGPRDGLQSESRILPVEIRAELIRRLTATGIDRIEVGSFVSPRAVPQMADTEAVLAALERRPGVAYAALALNLRGAERALAAGVDEVHFAFVATETFNQRNQRAAIADSLADFEAVAALAHKAGVRVTGTIGASFGCPFEGRVPPERVRDLAVSLKDRGADEIILADTIGVAVPAQVETLFAMVREAVGEAIPLGAHFHDTRGIGLANADAAIRNGASVLEASVGGLGGCPFAPAASGNIATEDLGYLLRQSGLPARLDLSALIETGRWLAGELGHALPGAVARAGLFPECARNAGVPAAGS